MNFERALRLAVVLLGLTIILGVSTDSMAEEEISASAPAPEYGIGTRPLWMTSRIVGSPEPPPLYTVKRVFSELQFKEPCHLTLGPGRQRFFLCEYPGRIVSFRNQQDVAETDLFLEVELNIHSLEFHPHFDSNRYVYVFGNTAPQREEGDVARNRILRFEVAEEYPPRAIPESQKIVLEYESDGHNGGEAKFGPDGYLYISSGDGTGDSDLWNTGQDVSVLPSGMFRIDVDHPDEGLAYGIPDDNPFVDLEDARGELWAFGFRNPWRFSFDRKTGNLYVGDVGQDLWEMIYLVQPGGNYGWSVKEGPQDFYPFRKVGPTPILPPLVAHHHTESRSITGGHVYRGKQLPKLQGAYVYGDYETGKIWGLRHEGPRITWHEELADTTLKPSTFGIGAQGQFYLVAHQLGEIYELVPAPKTAEQRPFPHRLSETGLFTSTERMIPAPGLIPYSVNAPQWCDGAMAERYIGLPGESQITFSNSGAWEFAEGAVLVKTLKWPAQEKGTSPRRIETQILTLQSDLWRGYSYVWNDEQTDAELAPPEGVNLDLSLADYRPRTWRIVSRTECMVCHSRAAAFVLGLQTGQMNRDFPYAQRTDNQLRTLDHLNVFTEPLPSPPAELQRLADPYQEQADLADRARAYLHANCSHCHVGAGGGNAKIVLTAQTKLAETFLVGGRPMHADFGIAGAMLLAPGDPSRSVLLERVTRRGNGQMPPLASNLVDQRAAKLIHDWIQKIDVPESAQEEVDRAVAEVQGDSGVLSRWEVAGPLEMPIEVDAIKSIASAQADVPSSGEAVSDADEALDWRRFIGEGAQCRVTLDESTADFTDPIWLARTDVIISKPCDIQLLAVSSGIVRVWLNSEQLSTQNGADDDASHSLRYDAQMNKGRNRLLVEIQRPVKGTPVFNLNFRRKSPNARREALIVAALSSTGNAERGRKLFFDEKRIQCIKCHRIGNDGGNVGPDLTGLGGRLSTLRIVESVLDPSRTVAPNYRTVAIELVAGRILSGIKTSESADTVTITNEQAEQLVISKSEITQMQVQPLSLMPEGLEKLVTTEEFVDLVTFLERLAAPPDLLE